MPAVKRVLNQRRLGYQMDAYGSVIAAITAEEVEYADGRTALEWRRYRIGPICWLTQAPRNLCLLMVSSAFSQVQFREAG